MVLTEEHKQEIVRRLVAEFHPLKIILFGSQAWGNPGEDSDVDIMIIVEHSDLRPAQRAAIAYGTLQGMSFSKDVIVKTRGEFEKYVGVFASLESKVSRKGVVLYGG